MGGIGLQKGGIFQQKCFRNKPGAKTDSRHSFKNTEKAAAAAAEKNAKILSHCIFNAGTFFAEGY